MYLKPALVVGAVLAVLFGFVAMLGAQDSRQRAARDAAVWQNIQSSVRLDRCKVAVAANTDAAMVEACRELIRLSEMTSR